MLFTVFIDLFTVKIDKILIKNDLKVALDSFPGGFSVKIN